jgi:hypothetical protein
MFCHSPADDLPTPTFSHTFRGLIVGTKKKEIVFGSCFGPSKKIIFFQKIIFFSASPQKGGSAIV